MTGFISSLFSNVWCGDIWATMVMSFVPLIELKGGIIFARGVGLGFFEAFGLAFVGSTLAFFLIFFLLKPVLKLLKKIRFIGKLAEKVELYFKDKAEKTLEERKKKNKNSKISETMIKALGVFLFVAIPLPMTGVWTGTAIAVFLDLKFKDAVLPVTIGNLVAGLIISLLAQICLWIFKVQKTAELALNIILCVLLGLAVILLAVFIIKVLTKKKKVEDATTDKENN